MMQCLSSKLLPKNAQTIHLIRPFSLSVTCHKTNKEWKAMKVSAKVHQSQEWQRKKNRNPFKRNVGLANQMQALNVDPKDPAILDAMQVNPDVSPAIALQELYEETKAFKAEMGQKPNDEISPDLLKAILTKNRFFPDPKLPNMLTWMEKQLVKQLHESDPGYWDERKLAEGFPVTEKMIKKILKMKLRIPPEKIQQHDQDVRENWKLLAEGRLEIPPDLREHINNHGDPQKRLDNLLPASKRYMLEKEIWKKYEKSLEISRPKPGQFGNIIADYHRKVEVKKSLMNKKEEKTESDIAEVNFQDIFSPDTEMEVDNPEPSPYRDTALLNTNTDLSQEKRVTLDQFQKGYSGSLSFSKMIPREEVRKVDPIKAKYLDWISEEERKDALITKPKILTAEKIIEEEKQTSWNDDISDVKRISDDTKHSPTPDDCYYDDEGNFLYRIPIETMVDAK